MVPAARWRVQHRRDQLVGNGPHRITVCSLAPTSYNSNYGQFQFPQSLLPDQFRDPDQTSLFQKVEPSRVHNFDIALP